MTKKMAVLAMRYMVMVKYAYFAPVAPPYQYAFTWPRRFSIRSRRESVSSFRRSWRVSEGESCQTGRRGRRLCGSFRQGETITGKFDNEISHWSEQVEMDRQYIADLESGIIKLWEQRDGEDRKDITQRELERYKEGVIRLRNIIDAYEKIST
jgi:hypothetical protein